MRYFLLDASAQVKRYVSEPGTPLVDFLCHAVPPPRLRYLSFGPVETFPIIIRARNDGRIDALAADGAITSWVWNRLTSDAQILHPSQQTLLNAAELVEAHNLNCTDAVLLRVALDLRRALRLSGDDLVLVAADHRLLRAARREALPAFDPETDDLPRLQTLLG